jgi:Reverse transcriptase (RNA-dependent DNA polymerase)
VCKSITINPLLKKPSLDPTNVKLSRPILNLSVLSKLIEQIVAKHLVNWLNTSFRFPDRQSSYRKHHSSETVLAQELSDVFSAIVIGHLALLSLLDLSAALTQLIFRSSLDVHLNLGINSTVLNWLTSYLTGRNQSVRYCGNASSNTVLTFRL